MATNLIKCMETTKLNKMHANLIKWLIVQSTACLTNLSKMTANLSQGKEMAEKSNSPFACHLSRASSHIQ